MMTSTYGTLIVAVALDNEPDPEKLCVCELLLPVELVVVLWLMPALATPPEIAVEPPQVLAHATVCV